jgi:hypothetical protein
LLVEIEPLIIAARVEAELANIETCPEEVVIDAPLFISMPLCAVSLAEDREKQRRGIQRTASDLTDLVRSNFCMDDSS